MWQIIIYLLLSATSPTFEAQTLDDRTVLGSLSELTDVRVTMDTADGKVSLDTEKLLGLSLKQKPAQSATAAGAWIELIDGSKIVSQQYTVKGETARIMLFDNQVLETPTQSIRWVRLQPESETMANQWSRILDKQLDGDILVVRKGDNLDYHQGVLHDVTPDVVQFKLDGEELPIKRSRVYGFSYRHPAGNVLPGAICRIADAFGSYWQARNISLDDKLQWITPTGLRLSQSLENVTLIDFSQGKIVYLSDLTPESTNWSPYFGTAKTFSSLQQFYAPRMDRNFESDPLQLAGTQYSKGLAIHSRTEMVYRLPGSFSRLKAVAGIDDAVRPHGNVRLVVSSESKVLLDMQIAGSDEPKPIDLDIAGAHRLRILVDFGDQAGFGDNLDLCNARITK